MKSLLDQFISPTDAFRPKSAIEMFALGLAQKLHDVVAVRHYVMLVDRYSQADLLCAYRRSLRAKGNADLGRRFQTELQRVQGKGQNGASETLISIRVERRTVAAAIFEGDRLEYTDARQLSSDHERALASAIGFITWILQQFPVQSAALESIVNVHEIQRRVLYDAIHQLLRDNMLSIWEIPRATLLEACGHPALKSREELRQVATAIWPVLAGTHAKVFIQDAAVLGLYVQTDRSFIIN